MRLDRGAVFPLQAGSMFRSNALVEASSLDGVVYVMQVHHHPNSPNKRRFHARLERGEISVGPTLGPITQLPRTLLFSRLTYIGLRHGDGLSTAQRNVSPRPRRRRLVRIESIQHSAFNIQPPPRESFASSPSPFPNVGPPRSCAYVPCTTACDDSSAAIIYPQATMLDTPNSSATATDTGTGRVLTGKQEHCTFPLPARAMLPRFRSPISPSPSRRASWS